jgi:hypothetical protein
VYGRRRRENLLAICVDRSISRGLRLHHLYERVALLSLSLTPLLFGLGIPGLVLRICHCIVCDPQLVPGWGSSFPLPLIPLRPTGGPEGFRSSGLHLCRRGACGKVCGLCDSKRDGSHGHPWTRSAKGIAK